MKKLTEIFQWVLALGLFFLSIVVITKGIYFLADYILENGNPIFHLLLMLGLFIIMIASVFILAVLSSPTRKVSSDFKEGLYVIMSVSTLVASTPGFLGATILYVFFGS